MMKVLYAIQGTGNGHLSRANDIVPLLEKKVELEILISGIQADVVPPFEVHYRCKGLSFIFGKKGGVDLRDTFRKTDLRGLRKEIVRFPVEKYDLIINDFEPISAWAGRLRGIPTVALSHQSAVLNAHAPRPKKRDIFGESILKFYAPTDYAYGFHFSRYDKRIYTPVIREEIRKQERKNLGHYTVYLPAYADSKIIDKLSRFKGIKWEVFSKHTQKSYRLKNVFIYPINNEAFIRSMASCEGVLCGAGFETPAEALFLGKKLLVMPMKAQYEQQCNAAALEHLGVKTIKSLKEKRLAKLEQWLNDPNRISVSYPNQTETILNELLENHLYPRPKGNLMQAFG